MILLTAGQEEFIDQYTRYQLAHFWCPVALRGEGTVNVGEGDLSLDGVYLEHAVAKKWLSRKDTNTFKVLSTGWKVAASFLKR